MAREDVDNPQQSTVAPPPPAGAGDPADNLLARPSPEAFLRALLHEAIGMSGAWHGAIWRMSGGQLVPAVELRPEVSESESRGWRQAMAELSQESLRSGDLCRRTVGEPQGRLMTGRAFVAVGLPIHGDAATAGCLALVVPRESPILSETGAAALRLLASLGASYAWRRSAREYESSYQLLSNAWQLIGETLAFTHAREIAQVAVNRGRAAFSAHRVAMGFVRSGKVTIAAVSGEDMVEKRSNFAQTLRAAQTEVVLSGEPGSYRATARADERMAQATRHPQHERLAQLGDARTVYSAPLQMGPDIVAVWTFEFTEDDLPDNALRLIDIAAGQLGPVLRLALQNDRGPFRRAADSLRDGVKLAFGKEHPWRRAGLAAAAALILFGVFGRWELNVAGNCTLQPSVRRIYAAPFDATIDAAPVRPGDTIKPGDTLVVFDHSELALRLRQSESKRASVEKEMLTYLAEQKLSEYAEAKAESESLAAEIDLIRLRLDQTEIQADSAGLVISGDLRQDIGRPVRMGQQLIEVAPINRLLLEVEVAQDDVLLLRNEQEGGFTTKARPGEPIPFKITRLRPAPETREGASVYIAEAIIENDTGWLRPGMAGAARIHTGKRNVTWVALRKIVGWIRFHLWW